MSPRPLFDEIGTEIRQLEIQDPRDSARVTPLSRQQVAFLGDLGDYPVVRLGSVARVQSGLTLDSGKAMTQPTVSRPYLRVANVQDGWIDFSEVKDIEVPKAFVHRWELRAGDVLMTEGGDADKLGRGTVWKGEIPGCLHQNHIFAVRPGKELTPAFLGFVLETPYARAYFESTSSKTTGIASTSISKITSLRIPLPAIEDQLRIVNFLEVETARVDALIAAKQRTMELLEERWATLRRNLIWPGESPGQSRLVQLRRIARLRAGAAFPHQYQGDSQGTIPYVKVGDLSNIDEQDELRGASNYVRPDVPAVLRSPILPSGTIVLPKIGAALLTNKRAILAEPSCLDQNVMGVLVLTGNLRFVFHCLACIDLGELSTPGPVPLLNEEAALSVRMPWPSSGEQDTVVATIDRYKKSIAAPKALLSRQVALLQERRQALITAAVTGQLDIRRKVGTDSISTPSLASI